jgi:hypothetical protein
MFRGSIFFTAILAFFLLVVGNVSAEEVKFNRYTVRNIDGVDARVTLPFPSDSTIAYHMRLSAWEYDEARNIMYFIPIQSSDVFLLDPSTLEVKGKIPVGMTIIDAEFVDNKLYAATSSQVSIIDLETQQVVETHRLAQEVKAIEYHNGKIIYKSTYDNYFEYKLGEKTEQRITFKTNTFHNSHEFSIHPTKDILYVASAYEIASFDANTYEWLQTTKLTTNYNLSTAQFHYDGDSVFYGTREFNSTNPSEVKGTFEHEQAIRFVSDDYVFTTSGVYSRQTYQQILPFVLKYHREDWPSDAHFFMKGDDLYVYLPEDQTIVKTKFSGTNPDLIKTKIPSIMEFNSAVTDYYHDTENKRIYLLFKQTNELVVMNSTDMSIIKRMVVGSKPSDIKLFNGKIYVAHEGTTKLLEMSSDFQTQQYIEVGEPMSEIAMIGNTLFFSGFERFESTLYKFDMNTKQLGKVDWSIDQKTSFYNQNNQLLVITRGSSSLQYEIFDESGKLLRSQSVSSVGGYYPDRFIFKNNTIVYGDQKGTYTGEGFAEDSFQRVFFHTRSDYTLDFIDNVFVSNLAVYNGNTRTRIHYLPEEAKYFTIANDKSGFLVPKDGKGLLKLKYPYEDTPKMRRLGYINFSIMGLSSPEFFPDIARSFARNEIEYLVKYAVISGYPDRTFRPKKTITNMEASIMLARAINLYGEDIPMRKLVELPGVSPHYSLVMTNLRNDTDAPIFANPSAKTTRKEMALAIQQAFGLKGSNNRRYKDLTAAKYSAYVPAIEALAYHGITAGYLDGTFKPDNQLTRDEFAAFVARAINEQYMIKK